MKFKMIMKKIVETTIQTEFEEQIMVSKYKRDKNRKDVRNGYYYRNLFTKFCYLENIKVPRARNMKVQFSAFDKWQRMTYGFKELVLDLILTGSSYRKIEEFLSKELTFLSSQSISRILRELKTELREFKTAPLEDDIVILNVDGMYVKIKGQSIVVLVAHGIDINGNKKIVDFEPCIKGESEGNYFGFLNKLFHRGLKGKHLKLIITDGNKGVKNSIPHVYPFSSHQICLFHVKQNIFKRVKRKNLKRFSRELDNLFNSTSYSMYKNKLKRIIEKFKGEEPLAIKYLQRLDTNALTYLKFDSDMYPVITTNNYVERFIGTVRDFLGRRSSFNNFSSLELFLFASVKNYNNKAHSLNPKYREAFKNFTQFS
jgi:putative transposase